MNLRRISWRKSAEFGLSRAIQEKRKEGTKMTVLLVLATFLVFIVLDYALNRRRAVATVSVERSQAVPAPVGGEYVNGFLVPENLSYHSGHSWLVRERKNVMRVGADEFAAALAGKVEKIELPKPGQWIRQGQKMLTLLRNGERVDMVSPTEGEVLQVNPEVVNDPALMRRDPYGKGWLLSIHVPDEENTGRNLLPKMLVREWMSEAVERLYSRQPQLAGAVAADGGRPAEDLLGGMPDVNWQRTAAEFFLTESR
jgi:glycine cleavage system H lipoate-binding protein